jgi:ferredoxin
MKISIDREGCISCGNCWTICPEVFEENPDDNKSEVVPKYRSEVMLGEGQVQKDQEECAKKASADCPAQVIAIT